MTTQETKKRVFILGAGSSIGHSNGEFPSINQFFSRAKKIKLDLSDEYSRVANYIQRIRGVDINRNPTLNIEEIFTHLEIDIEKKSFPDFLNIRQSFLRLIQLVLFCPDKPDWSEYHKFKTILNDKKDTIITFNWDLLLDNILDRTDIFTRLHYHQVQRGSYYHNLVFELSAFSQWDSTHIPIMPPYFEWKHQYNYYLKMHGSIDWFYCSNEHCRAFSAVFPLLKLNEIHYCSECHEPAKCMIIPPILNKSYHQYPFIRRIWNVAAKEMSMAEEIVIWGYSLPPTDFYASWLLSQARIGSLQQITLIDPAVIDNTKTKISMDFVKHFYTIFQDILAKVDEPVILYENYLDFHEGIDVFKKYSLDKTEFYAQLHTN